MKERNFLKSEAKLQRLRFWLNMITWLGMLGMIIFAIYLYVAGYLTDVTKLRLVVERVGPWAPIVFVFIQIVQIVIPILPGGVTTLAGVLIFGPVWGFVWNYMSCCLGSLLAFHIAKVYGRPVLRAFFSDKMIETYERKTNADSNFSKYFALAIFFPFAPDDFLCYLAGTTSMTYRQFIWIILLGKPASILIYSMGLTTILSKLFGIGL